MEKEDFHKWASELIASHKTSAIKFDLNRSKLVYSEDLEDHNLLLDLRIVDLKKILSLKRAERRCARCKITWDDEQRVGIVEGIIGAKYRNFGYQKGPNKVLFPEEILTLLEMNKAEFFYKNATCSIEFAYSFLIKNIDELYKYKIFRKLAVEGFNIKRPEIYERNLPTTTQEIKKIKLDTPKESEDMQDIYTEKFLMLQKRGPKTSDLCIKNTVIDYKFSGADNKFEYNLFFIDDQVPPTVGFCDNICNNIYSSKSKGTEAFMHFSEIKLPNLF